MYEIINHDEDSDNLPNRVLVKKYQNTIKILAVSNIKGQVQLEISYLKNNGIQIRKIFIYPVNINSVLSKFSNNNFIISNSETQNVSNLDTLMSNTNHPEYSVEKMHDFKKQSFNNSFNQKFFT